MNSQDHSVEYHRRICRAIDFISSHLADNPTVAEIATAAPFSSFHFQRLFRALLGESVAEFTRRIRLETAARRLRFRSHEEITGLAMELGFSSSQNFSKAFKLHFHLSPTEYRRQNSDSEHPNANHQDKLLTTHASRIQVVDGRSIERNVTVRDCSAIRVVYRRHFGSYNEPGVQTAFDDLQRWADARRLHHEDCYIGIPWDDTDVTPDKKCRFDACLEIDDGVWLGNGVNTQIIPAGRYAVYQSEVIDNNFDLPWTRLLRVWLAGSGYQPADGPRFERYHSDGSQDPKGCWDLEIFLPVIPL